MKLGTLKATIRKILKKDKDIAFAYIFGSLASGLSHPYSDLDIAIYLKPGNKDYYHKKEALLLGDLCSGLKGYNVDLILLNVAPLVLQFRVISEGIVIYSTDEQARVDFETSVLYRYFELKPLLDEYYQLLIEEIKAG